MQENDKTAADRSLAGLTTEIVTAYVLHNTISPADIGRLIADIGRALHALGEDKRAVPEKPEPAVPVRRSVGTDYLVCLVCGKKQRLLKRHLASEHDLTPHAYRRLFDLKADYPIVAPSYTEMRREFALKIGLGRPRETPEKRNGPKRKWTARETDTQRPAAPEAEAPAKARRTRRKAAV